MSIEVRHVSKSFGSFRALCDVSLRIDDGQLVALLGPSGSGKTTLLRIIAGLEQPDPDPQTQIRLHDVSVANRGAGQRRVGFVFQHYALFRHMTVFENVAFGLRVRRRRERPARREIRRRVEELLQLVQLEGFGDRYPAQLSGGQRQRVALARALAVQPRVLLLDEPFGALDAQVRQSLRSWLRKLHEEIHLTSVLVTHDQEEALEVADRVVVMNQARIEQVGAPEEVFHHPASPFVMEFLGQVNVFHGRVRSGQAMFDEMTVDYPGYMESSERTASVYVRPHELDIRTASGAGTGLPIRIRRINPAGPRVRLTAETGRGSELVIDISLDQYRSLGLAVGDQVFAYPRNPRVYLPELAP